jgi:hypothetical protein
MITHHIQRGEYWAYKLKLRGGQGETLVPPTAVAGGDEEFVFEFEASDNNNSG